MSPDHESRPGPIPTGFFLAALQEPLQRLQLATAGDDVSLRLRPRNPLRRDYEHRFDFLVLRAEIVVCHLSVGRDLRRLRAQVEAFSSACPDVSVRPLFWHSADGWDFLGSEYFPGQPIAARPGESAGNSAQLARVLASLRSTTQPSSPAALRREFDQIRAEVLALPVWGRLDRVLLEDVVFPFVESGSLTIKPETRWTNGDFVAGNVLVDPAGDVRLVDCEFAHRTHFFALDAWRWHRFAADGSGTRDFLSGLPVPAAWLEVLGILQHMVMLHTVNADVVAQPDSVLCVRELLGALGRGHGRFRGEMLLGQLPRPDDHQPVAQLFWSESGEFSEASSQSLAYEPERETTLLFTLPEVSGPLHLRFDPTDRAGLIALSRIRIVRVSDGKPIVDWNAAEAGENTTLANALTQLEPSDTYNLLSSGLDPQLNLAVGNLGDSAQSVRCEIRLLFSPNLSRLPALLPKDHAAIAAVECARDELQQRHDELVLRHDELLQSLHRQNEALLDYAHRSQLAADDHECLRLDLNRAHHRIRDLEAVIASKVEQISVAMNRVREFETMQRQLEETRSQLAAESAACRDLQRQFAALEARPLVRFDRFIRCEIPVSSEERVL